MATSTYQTYLMCKAQSSGSYEKLIDIVSLPDLGAPPEQIDVTTLSDRQRKYIPGIEDTGSLEFDVNYDATSFSKIDKLGREKEYEFAVYLGADASNEPDGHLGKFTFTGKVAITKKGGGVNEAQGASVTIYPTTDVTFASGDE